MSSGLYSGVSGLALGIGLYRGVSGLWGGASGLDAGFAGGSPYSGASLYLDFLTMTAPTFDSRITFSRGTNATLTDSTGRITYAPANLLLRSQEFDNAAWTKSNTTVSTGVADPLGGTTACTVTATASSGHILQQVSLPAGINAIPSIWLRRRTGTGAIRMWNAAGGTVDVTSSVTSTWTRIQTPVVACSTGPFLFLQIATSGDAVDVWGAQFEPVTYQTTPSTYVATAGSSYYGPRFDYDPVTLAARGLLIEEQRTNLLTYSEEFDRSYWIKARVTVTANATTSPDGTTDADKLVEDTNNNSHVVYTSSVTPSGTSTLSVYAKPAGRDWVILETDAANTRSFFNVATGALGTIGSAVTATITAAGNGWYRCTITGSLSGGTGSIYFGPASANNVASYTGDGTSGIFAYGAQLEAGAFPTSYIPTVASQVTRNADVATMTGTNFSGWYNQSEGTFVANASDPAISAAANIFTVDDSTTQERIRLLTDVTDPKMIVTDGNVTQANLDGGAIAVNTPFAFAGAYSLNDFAVVLNGGTAVTDTSGTIPTVTTARLGADSAGNYLNGHLRVLAYYNTRLSNSQLQTLTAPSLSTTLNLDFINGAYNVGF